FFLPISLRPKHTGFIGRNEMEDSRRIALDVLVACLDKGQPFDDALGRYPGFPALDPRDRAFVRLLLATTLRRLGEIETVLGAMIERPLEGANAVGRQILRLGTAQLLFLGTPAHAAVDTSVELAQSRLPHLKSLTNAVLRRVAREGVAMLGDRDPARLNTPQWLWESWVASYGEETARAIAAAHLIEAPLDLTPRSDADFWAGQLEAEKLPIGTLRRRAGGAISELPGYAEGAWWVQDAAATLPVRLLGNVTGKRVADLCAAPGGKTLQLYAAGALVTAVDISARRIGRLNDNLARAGMTAELVTADAGREVRRHPAGRSLLRHRHPAPPSRHRRAQGQRGRESAHADPGPPAGAFARPPEAGRYIGLRRLLPRGGRRLSAHRSAAGPRAPGETRAG